MKKTILYSLAVLAGGLTLASCSEDKLSNESVIVVSQTEENEFDKWLTANLVKPYNIQFKYRYDYNETNNSYYTVPADYDAAVKMVHIVKYSCIEAYNDVAGMDFTRTYFPKLFYLEGEWLYDNNGDISMGVAQNGRKIFLQGLNHLDQYMVSRELLNRYYLKTVHHEFTHVLNMTVTYTASFQLISGNYVADQWSNTTYSKGYLERGFVSAYAQENADEDFAETLSLYVTSTQEQWEQWLIEAAGSDGKGAGRGYIESKLSVIRAYMKDSFNIDIDELRDEVLRREQDILDGKVDLMDISLD